MINFSGIKMKVAGRQPVPFLIVFFCSCKYIGGSVFYYLILLALGLFF